MTSKSSCSNTGSCASTDANDPVHQLQLDRGHLAVVGLQWGDEGKGKIVDLLTRRFDVVARYNGGANAGHSVQVGDQRYALHLIPSGILYPDKLNVLGNGVVLDPEVMMKEMSDLRERGVHIDANLRISDRAHVVLPYHKVQDALTEKAIAKAQGEAGKIGTTGRGIGPCYADKAARSTAIRAGDLVKPDQLRSKLKVIVAIKNAMLGALAQSCGEPYEPFDAGVLADTFIDYGRKLSLHIGDTTRLLHETMAKGKHILFEGANATLLDIDHGTFPYVTSSNCSSLGVYAGTGVPGQKVSQVIGIVKAYSTRVGGGPMPTELHDEIGHRIREVGREYGTTTGRPRRCGWLDLVALQYTTMVSGATGIALMLLDVLAGLETLKVCTGYRYNGQTLSAFPSDADVLASVEPVYETLPGFSEPVSECKTYDQLPTNAKKYIRMIQDRIGVPVLMVSVGPRRDQTLLPPCLKQAL